MLHLCVWENNLDVEKHDFRETGLPSTIAMSHWIISKDARPSRKIYKEEENVFLSLYVN